MHSLSMYKKNLSYSVDNCNCDVIYKKHIIIGLFSEIVIKIALKENQKHVNMPKYLLLMMICLIFLLYNKF